MARQIKSPNIEKSFYKLPYFSVLGVLVFVILFAVLWRPLNLERTVYIPLSSQAETTVINNPHSSVEIEEARIEMVDGKPDAEQVTES